MFEVSLEGPEGGSPFVDVQIGAEFRLRDNIKGGKFEYAGEKDFALRLSIRD